MSRRIDFVSLLRPLECDPYFAADRKQQALLLQRGAEGFDRAGLHGKAQSDHA
jgi:hypothetical protein